jgi:hypothetical protein
MSREKETAAMTVREGPPEPVPPPKREQPVDAAERASGGRIALTSPTRQAVFIAGLAGAFVLGLLLVIAA